MASHLQFVPDESKKWNDSKGRPIAIAEVTVSVIMRMFLLKPTPRNTELILGVIGRAQAKYDFEIYAYAFLSNHGSYLIGVRSAEHMSDIKCYIHSNVAREVLRSRDCQWNGSFYGRPARSILVLTDENILDRIRYICANSTKEHLVTHPCKWPGAHSARALCSGNNDTGLWIDRTATSEKARKHTGKRGRPPVVMTTYEVKLSKVPPLAHMTDKEYRDAMTTMCDDIAAEAAEERRLTGKRVMGIKRIMRFSSMHIPEGDNRSPAPFVHCCEPKMRRAFVVAYKAFAEAYRIANELLREGLDGFVVFPEGGHPPISCRLRKAG